MAIDAHLNALAGSYENWIAFRRSFEGSLDFSNVDLAKELRDRGLETASQEITFERYDFAGATFSDSELTYIDFIDCDLTDAKLRHSRVGRCGLEGGRLDNLDLSGSDISESSFRDLTWTAATVKDAQMTGCWFTNCDMTRANFAAVDLSNSKFKNCDLTGMRVSIICFRTGQFEEQCYYSNMTGVEGISQGMLDTMQVDPSVDLPEGLTVS